MYAEIGPQGGAILALAAGGVDLLRRTPAGREADPLAAACFPLVPFGNRVRANGFTFAGRRYTLIPNHRDRHYLHGDGWLSHWDAAERTDDAVTLHLHQPAGRTPYCYTTEQRFVLGEDALAVTLAVRNTGADKLPFGLGLHPYFPLSPATTLRAAATCFWPEAEDLLPGSATGIAADRDFSRPRVLPQGWTNTGFGGWDGRAEIVWPERRMALDIAAEAAFRVWFLFVSDPAREPGYAFDHFCFEPMTHAPDAHNAPDLGGLAVLAPGEELRAGVTFRARDLAER
jgi:aldose 1-epimerase